MSEQRPIEIRPEDMIKRPADLPVKAGSKPGGFLGNLKENLKTAKEMLDLARELGLTDELKNMGISLNLPGARNQSPQGGQDTSPDRPPPGGDIAGYQALVKLLRLQYGDITVNELVEKLRADFGNKRLSDFLGER